MTTDKNLPEPYKFSYGDREYIMPADMRAYLDNYRFEGIPLGGFLQAVVSNDFVGACGRADADNLPHLPAFAAYVHWEMPAGCHGSVDAYESWLARFAVEVES